MGSGSIRERSDGRYQVRVYLGVDPVTKKKRWVERTIAGKRAAEALRNQLLVDAKAGRPQTQATFGALAEAWLETADLAVSTVAAYRVYLTRHILPALGDVPLDGLSADRLDRLYKALRRRLGPSSVNKTHHVISACLAQGVRWGWLRENVAERASPPPARRVDIAPPSPLAVARLLAAAEEWNPDLGVYGRLLAVTGARRGEMAAFRWGDFDLERGEVKIARARAHGGRGVVVEKGTKTENVRTIALDAGTVDVLRAHLLRCRTRALAAGASLQPDGYLFALDVDGGRPWRPDGATSRFRRLKVRAGIAEPLTIRSLRHFSATRQLAAGVPIRTVAGRLGHSRASTTTDIYGHFVKESDRTAADVMGAVLDAEA